MAEEFTLLSEEELLSGIASVGPPTNMQSLFRKGMKNFLNR